jgi:Zn-dependent protease
MTPMDVTFSKQEWTSLGLTFLVVSFILSFTRWGTTTFDAAFGIKNLIGIFLVVSFSMLVKLYVQKYYARKSGYATEFKPWMSGLLLGFVAVFATNGKIIFLALGALAFVVIEKANIGSHYTEVGYAKMGWLSMLGVVTNIVIALLAKMITTISSHQILTDLVVVNLWLALFAMIPIPYLDGFKRTGTSDGLKLLYAAPLEYFISVALLALSMYAILFLSVKNALYVMIGSLVLMYLTYYLFYKQNLYVPKTKKTRHYLP